jgi:teichuronic acid biosynthesis glycosyltransferase TuaH
MKILYIMHVDWRWIKQRPQFLAEELSSHYSLRVLDRRSPLQKGRILGHGACSPVPLLPLPWSWPIIRIATNWLQRRYVTIVLRRFRPDIIWLTHPSLLAFLPRWTTNVPVVYDCMDDVFGFKASSSRRSLLAKMENQLVARSASIFCSSENLKEVLLARYGKEGDRKTRVVRNGISALILRSSAPVALPPRNGSCTRVAYTGTIAEWMDFRLLLQSLKRHNDLEFHLIGPTGARDLPTHERLILHGVVSHDELLSAVEQFDAFVMPFLVTPLIESVDPVKLYEYISYARPTISVYYREIRRLEPYLHFYRNEEEFNSLIGRLVRGDLPLPGDDHSRQRFLENNTWSSRCHEIRERLESARIRRGERQL